MSLTFDDAKSRLNAIKDTTKINGEFKQLKQKYANNLEKDKSEVLSQLNDIKKDYKRFKREVKSSFEELLSFAQLGVLGSENFQSPFRNSKFQSPFGQEKGNIDNSSSMTYLKKKMILALRKIEPEVGKILFEETLHAIGCSQEQAFPTVTNPIYIKVKSIDLFDMLKLDPSDIVGDARFEKGNPSPGTTPFQMNKELWNRIQNKNVLYSASYGGAYVGASGQQLFDIEYVDTGPAGQSGDYFRVFLKNRLTDVNGLATTTNRVGDFVADYYRSIKIIDFTAIFSFMIDVLLGAVSMKVELGTGTIEDQTKFSLLIQRVLGLCFDGRNEIDVSGIAKISESDGFDDSFFEFTEIDLRTVDQRITDIQNKVTQFESCGELKLTFDYEEINKAVANLNKFVNSADQDNAADQLSDTITQSIYDDIVRLQSQLGYQLQYPTIEELKLDVDFNFVANLPRSFIFSILSPKVLLPVFIMLKAIQQLGANTINAICQDEINSMQDFFKCFKSFMKNLVSKIGALFVRELFDLIKKDIRRLIQSLIKDLAKEQITKRYAMILALVQLLLLVAQFVQDWRKCKSVLDEIFALLDLGLSFAPSIPSPLLALSAFSSGTSPTRAMTGAIEEMQSVGIPTGPLPDGSPNLFVMSQLCTLKGQDSENAKNGKTEVLVKGVSKGPFIYIKATGKSY